MSFRVKSLTVNLTDPVTVYLDYSFEGKRPDAPALKKAVREALSEGLRLIEEKGVEVTGTYWEGPTNRRDELRAREK